MTDLLFYDTEATDADRRHGQITQFAALRTDEDFKEIERTDVRVRLLPWVVPTPGAMDVTGMKCEDLLTADRISEFEAARHISRIMEPARGEGRVFVTYYGIGFDDELIRTTLYRNLLYPYPMSGKGRVRVDMLPVVRLAHHLQPDSLVAPWDAEKERISWRLEKVCPANGIALKAHDALEDTVALSALTRLVRDRAPWAWDAAMKAGNAQAVETMLEEASRRDEPLFLFTHFGRPEVVPCFPMASNGKRKHVLVDLRSETYPTSTDDAMLCVNKAGTPYPIIRSNLSPIFVDHEHLSAAHDFDLRSLTEKIRVIKQDSGIVRTCAAVAADQEFTRSGLVTSEDRIYDGFFDRSDSWKMKQFVESVSWDQRAAIGFDDVRLDDFAARVVLDAVYSGEAVVEDDDRMALERRCAEALARPFSSAEAHFATIEAVMMQDPPQDWVDWATRHFCLEEEWTDGRRHGTDNSGAETRQSLE